MMRLPDDGVMLSQCPHPKASTGGFCSRFMSADPFHQQLLQASAAYGRYSSTRLAGWSHEGYDAAQARLGSSEDYAAHYVEHLLPLLRNDAGFADAVDAAGSRPLRFLDLGCAPGGLCRALTSRWGSARWSGVGVTLDPAAGGLPMQFTDPNVEVRFADVTDRESFVKAALRTPQDEHSFDFVNLGIVLDASVKSKLDKVAIGFGEQLFTQLLVAERALRRDGRGSLMLALKVDYTSLPDTMPTLEVLRRICAALRIIPTMYTAATGKKQFYAFAARLPSGLTMEACTDIQRIWSLGKMRYRAFCETAARRLQEGKRERAVTNESDLPKSEAIITTAAVAPEVPSVANGFDPATTVKSLYADGCPTGQDLNNFFQLVTTALRRCQGLQFI